MTPIIMEAKKCEVEEHDMIIKRMVLHPISMTLYKLWENIHANLEKIGVFNYLCWIQRIIIVTYVK